MLYQWSRAGVEHAVEAVMRGHPELEQPFWVAESRDSGDFTLEAEAKGTLAVDGMPLNLGKHGKLRKATATWSLEEGKLIGQTRFEASFRVLFFAKR